MEYQKLGVWAIIAVLIVSMVPLAFADEGNDTDDDNETSENSGSGSTGSGNGVDISSPRQRLKEQRQNLRDQRETIRDVREGVKNIRSEIRETTAIRREKFGELRDTLKTACKQNKDSTECADARAAFNTDARAYLVHVAERMLEMLQNARAKIEASTTLDATVKANLLAAIDARISAVTAIKAKIDALPAEPSREEVKALAKELNAAWKDVRHAVRNGLGRMVNNRISGIIVKSEQLSARLTKTLERLEARGIDTSGIESQVDTFNQQIADAKAAHEAAVALFASGDVEGAQAKLKEARQALKDAHTTLKAIVAAIKEANGGNLGVGQPPSNTSGNSTGNASA